MKEKRFEIKNRRKRRTGDEGLGDGRCAREHTPEVTASFLGKDEGISGASGRSKSRIKNSYITHSTLEPSNKSHGKQSRHVFAF